MVEKPNLLQKTARLAGKVWLASIAAFFVLLAPATNFFRVELTETKFGNSQLFTTLMVAAFLIGSVAFVIAIASFFINLARPKDKKRVKIYVQILRFLFLPIVFAYEKLELAKTMKNIKRQGLKKTFNLAILVKKTISGAFILLLLLPFWGAGYAVLGFIAGLVPYSTSVIGASMLPTFEENDNVGIYNYNPFARLIRKINRGDIVIFQSGKTVDKDGGLSAFIKRVVAITGDKVEVRDGFLSVNGQIVEEPYLNKARSTFGGQFLQECKTIEVPDGYVFVLGDNRKRSEDSRNIGFVSLQEISNVLPYSKQGSYKSKWHDASKDSSQAGHVSFNNEEYYKILNDKRKEVGLRPLKVSPKLERAAEIRAETIIKYNEVELQDLEKSNYPMSKALRDAGYYNTIYGEIAGYGYYDSEELLNYWFESTTKDFLLSSEYQDTGITAVVGKINGCETQVIVQEFGAYVPPNYSKDVIGSWESTLSRLREIYPSWENIKKFPLTYNSNKSDADRLLQILQTRISRIGIIVSKMKANQWLSTEENNWTYEDEKLFNEQETIAKRLNSQVWK